MISETVVAPIVENTAKVKGTSYRTVYKVHEISNKVEAVVFCINSPMLAGYISIDTKGIERLVNAQKGNLEIPGIKIIEDTQVSLRG